MHIPKEKLSENIIKNFLKKVKNFIFLYALNPNKRKEKMIKK